MIPLNDVTALIITRGDVPELMTERLDQFRRLGVTAMVVESPDILTRYTTAERFVKTTAVFFQDDDVALTDEDILNILENYEPGILVSNMYDEWIESQGYFDLALVGLGSVCDVGLWHDAFQRWLAAYGESTDGILGLKWDADFIFGVLAPWRRFNFTGDRVILDQASADNRLWKQPGQHERKFESIDMARKLRTVVLTIMAKNESENVKRALTSAAGWYDSVVLLDTGSTDDTQDIVMQHCIDNDLPCFSTQEPFTTFQETRTRLLELGRARGDYMLLMDADEEWVDLIERPVLFAEAYMLHYDGPVDYAQPRLIASRFPWKWSGERHSYLDWDWEGEVLAVNMDSPRIVHHGDARHGDKKVTADIEWLLAEIERTEEDLPRNLFLLAKAYDGTEQFDKAIDAYERRIALDSHDEEDYWCRLRLGNLLAEHCNNFVAAIETLWMAYNIRPHRAEALRAICFYCTAVADATPYPEDDIVLVLRNMYRVT